MRNRLVVWDAGGELLLPDAIVDLAFRLDEEWSPIEVGVEEDGLNEFLLQPLRQAGVRRRTGLPLRAVRAPRGKIDFIRSLQPFFRNGEVEFAKPLDTLVDQLLGFPTGRIDAPNALAYAILNRAGLPVYEGFDPRDHITRPFMQPRKPLYLAANAVPGIVTAALLQYVEGEILVFADWIIEGAPAEVFEDIAREASLLARSVATVVAPREHFQRYANIGLAQAVRGVPMEIRPGGEAATGRGFLSDYFGRRGKNGPVVEIAEEARWTLNALAGGYSRAVRTRGAIAMPTEAIEDSRYKVLMEGIESFCALLSLGMAGEDEDEHANWAFDRSGRRYKSAMPDLGRARLS